MNQKIPPRVQLTHLSHTPTALRVHSPRRCLSPPTLCHATYHRGTCAWESDVPYPASHGRFLVYCAELGVFFSSLIKGHWHEIVHSTWIPIPGRDLHKSEPFCPYQPGSPLAHRLRLFAMRAQSIWFRSNLTSRVIVQSTRVPGAHAVFTTRGTTCTRSILPTSNLVRRRSVLFTRDHTGSHSVPELGISEASGMSATN